MQQERENQPVHDSVAPVLIQLLKGVIYQDRQAELWRDLLSFQAVVRDYFSRIGLELFIDESEGYAFLKQSVSDEESQPELPRLIQRRQLSYQLSLLLVLLRKKLIELDATGGQTRLIVSREQMKEMLLIFLPESSNEAKMVEGIDRHINRLIDYGFLRRLKGEENRYEVHRIIKALVDAQWLSDFNGNLKVYHDHAARTS
ncbi:MAG: DUF4194 domain-containing protein [Desulfobulbaceae bacterium]|nr:DUF4194 domain-containing protein [Desulfobulbaceae bacterium]